MESLTVSEIPAELGSDSRRSWCEHLRALGSRVRARARTLPRTGDVTYLIQTTACKNRRQWGRGTSITPTSSHSSHLVPHPTSAHVTVAFLNIQRKECLIRSKGKFLTQRSLCDISECTSIIYWKQKSLSRCRLISVVTNQNCSYCIHSVEFKMMKEWFWVTVFRRKFRNKVAGS